MHVDLAYSRRHAFRHVQCSCVISPSFMFVNKARIPTNKAIEEARLKTFGEDWWPHDEEANHGANSRKVRHLVLLSLLSDLAVWYTRWHRHASFTRPKVQGTIL